MDLILNMDFSLSVFDTIAILFICWMLFWFMRSRNNLLKRINTLEQLVDKRFSEYFQRLDDKNYRLWKAKLKLEEKLKKAKKSAH